MPPNKWRTFHLVMDSKMPDDLVTTEEDQSFVDRTANDVFHSFCRSNKIHPWDYQIIERSLVGAKMVFHILLKNEKFALDMYKPLDLEIIEIIK